MSLSVPGIEGEKGEKQGASTAPSTPRTDWRRRQFFGAESIKASLSLLRLTDAGVVEKKISNGAVYERLPMNQMKIQWQQRPSTVLLVSKVHDAEANRSLSVVARWLCEERHMDVLVESVAASEVPELKKFSLDQKDETIFDTVDLVVCIGGDGTMLHAASLFTNAPCPPMLCFHLGTLGFLMPFDLPSFKRDISKGIAGDCDVILRMRLYALLFRHQQPEPAEEFTVVNEVVISRGASPSQASLTVFCNGRHLTVIAGDGIIIATPTGSTAYSLAAGGSMVHPEVPGILFTPICPHILASRPLILPDHVELRVELSSDSRAGASVSFDARGRFQLDPGDYLLVSASKWPVPCFTREDPSADWYESLSECLSWNNRKRQRIPEKLSFPDEHAPPTVPD